MCEGVENYVPLNDGYNWKGDPNATLSGQPVPQLPTDATTSTAAPKAATPPPIAVAQYDPNTGTYVGPDGQLYTQTDLARDVHQHQSWQDMLLPPKGQ
jgi:phospholipid/cholesterol/gamma-HCH transport system substrate-binding protein